MSLRRHRQGNYSVVSTAFDSELCTAPVIDSVGVDVEVRHQTILFQFSSFARLPVQDGLGPGANSGLCVQGSSATGGRVLPGKAVCASARTSCSYATGPSLRPSARVTTREAARARWVATAQSPAKRAAQARVWHRGRVGTARFKLSRSPDHVGLPP